MRGGFASRAPRRITRTDDTGVAGFPAGARGGRYRRDAVPRRASADATGWNGEEDDAPRSVVTA